MTGLSEGCYQTRGPRSVGDLGSLAPKLRMLVGPQWQVKRFVIFPAFSPGLCLQVCYESFGTAHHAPAAGHGKAFRNTVRVSILEKQTCIGFSIGHAIRQSSHSREGKH